MTHSRTPISIFSKLVGRRDWESWKALGIYVLIPALLFLLVVHCSVRMARGDTQTTSGQTAQNIIDQARVLLNGISDTTTWSDTQLLRHVNDGIVSLVAKTQCLQSVETKPVTSGATTYSISGSYSRIAGALYTSGATDYQKALIKASIWDPKSGMGGSDTASATGEPTYYDDWNNTLYVWPTPAASSGSILLFLVDKPSGLSLVSAIPTPFIYDQALVYYVVWHALLRDRKFGAASEYYRALFTDELLNYRTDYFALRAAQSAQQGGK